ncbi:hypothetical protein ACWCQ0_46815 [Streptomyces massasporeus]
MGADSSQGHAGRGFRRGHLVWGFPGFRTGHAGPDLQPGQGSEQGPGQGRGARAVVLAACGGLLVTGCATMPDSGDAGPGMGEVGTALYDRSGELLSELPLIPRSEPS